jgi:RNA polymerase sigma-70 factor (ECF subfamily)
VKRDKYAHISDRELLDHFNEDGSNEWLGILLQRYTLLLLGTCMKYLKDEDEAKDAVQQVFLKAITELHKYKVEYFKSWIYMVARNYCLMKLRDKNVVISVDEQTQLQSQEDDKLELIDKNKTLDAMDSSLSELNEEQRECVSMFYLQKKSYQEIVAKTGFTMMQVKSHIQNGKRNLKILVEKKMKQV